MSRAAKTLWGCATLAVICFIALALIAKLWIEPQGFMIFDSHLRGYSPVMAKAFLEAITAEQTQVYLGIFRQIDTVFPVLATISLAGAIWLNARGVRWGLRGVAALCPLVYLMLDLAENAAVAQMLRIGPLVFDGSILQASALTQGKWICLAVSFILLVWAWRVAPKTPEPAA